MWALRSPLKSGQCSTDLRLLQRNCERGISSRSYLDGNGGPEILRRGQGCSMYKETESCPEDTCSTMCEGRFWWILLTICFSVLEPDIHSFCHLGRVFVNYNAQRNTWHCACAKPRISCPHKNIAKWHPFQTQRDLFQSNVPLSSGPPSLMTQEGSSCEDSAAVERSIRYIFKEKKIPQCLPEDVISQKTEHQKQLIPFETLCQVCPDHPKVDAAVSNY